MGLDAPAHPSSTILWPCPAPSHDWGIGVFSLVPLPLSLKRFSRRWWFPTFQVWAGKRLQTWPQYFPCMHKLYSLSLSPPLLLYFFYIIYYFFIETLLLYCVLFFSLCVCLFLFFPHPLFFYGFYLFMYSGDTTTRVTCLFPRARTICQSKETSFCFVAKLQTHTHGERRENTVMYLPTAAWSLFIHALFFSFNAHSIDNANYAMPHLTGLCSDDHFLRADGYFHLTFCSTKSLPI